MKAERNKRAIILEAEAAKQDKVLRAEGEKQSKILMAEGDKEARIREAEGLKEAKELEAQGAKAIEEIAKAEQNRIELLREANIDERILAYKSFESLEEVAKDQQIKSLFRLMQLKHLVLLGQLENLKKNKRRNYLQMIQEKNNKVRKRNGIPFSVRIFRKACTYPCIKKVMQ